MCASRLKVVFMGAPEFAVPHLRALHEHHDVAAVVTQPDRPRGRGRAVAAPPVKVVATELGLPVLQPERLRRRSVREALSDYGADAFVVVAFGQILSERLLAVPRLGCVNVHASLLPRYRGAAPIQWAVLNGEKISGVTIMQMDAGVDTGPILLQEQVHLGADETAGSLHDRLAPWGARLLVRALRELADGTLQACPQDDAMASDAPMLRKDDGHVDFTRDADAVACWIRGMDPWPGAFTLLDGQKLKLYGARPDQGRGRAGEVLAVDDRGVQIACGQGAVWVAELQLPGRRRLAAAALHAGRPLPWGTVLR